MCAFSITTALRINYSNTYTAMKIAPQSYIVCATMSHESPNICRCIQTLIVTPDQCLLAGCVCPGTGPVTKGDNS